MGVIFPEHVQTLSFTSVLFRLFVSMLVGGMLGLERGRKRRPAGCRTYMLVCLGATLTMLLGQYEAEMLTSHWNEWMQQIGQKVDVSRFSAQVINGIGFLAAGTILVTGQQEVKGLTTAAGLWASACMGLAVGAGFYECVLLCAFLVFLCMRYLPILENYLIERAQFITLYVVFQSLDNIGAIIAQIKAQNAQIYDVEVLKGGCGQGQNPSVVFSIHLREKQPHAQILSEIATLPCIYSIDEF